MHGNLIGTVLTGLYSGWESEHWHNGIDPAEISSSYHPDWMETVRGLILSAGSAVVKRISGICLILMVFHHPCRLVNRSSLVVIPGEKDPDPFDIILEVRGMLVEDEGD